MMRNLDRSARIQRCSKSMERPLNDPSSPAWYLGAQNGLAYYAGGQTGGAVTNLSAAVHRLLCGTTERR